MFLRIIKKILKFFIFLIVFLSIVFLISSKQSVDFYSKIPELEKSLGDTVAFINNAPKEIINPPPLIGKKEFSDSFLTAEGIIKWTNIQRNKNGALPPLLENEKLNAIAKERMDDMFEKQYFDHISPEGLGVSDMAKQDEYEFIIIGENLALGSFENDQDIVQAWMDSPGHRENILNDRYREIGVAVGRGNYEGHKTWIGVQIFSLPSSACPQPDQEIKNFIDIYQTKIDELENSTGALKREIESIDPKNAKEIRLYNKKVDDYNGIINEINVTLSYLKNLVSEYNHQVEIFNNCAKG